MREIAFTSDPGDSVVHDLERIAQLYVEYYPDMYSFTHSYSLGDEISRGFCLNSLLELHALEKPPEGWRDIMCFLVTHCHRSVLSALRNFKGRDVPMSIFPWHAHLSEGVIAPGGSRSVYGPKEAQEQLAMLFKKSRFSAALVHDVIRELVFEIPGGAGRQPNGSSDQLRLRCVSAVKRVIRVLFYCHIEEEERYVLRISG